MELCGIPGDLAEGKGWENYQLNQKNLAEARAAQIQKGSEASSALTF